MIREQRHLVDFYENRSESIGELTKALEVMLKCLRKVFKSSFSDWSIPEILD